jgi:hypothetical protein
MLTYGTLRLHSAQIVLPDIDMIINHNLIGVCTKILTFQFMDDSYLSGFQTKTEDLRYWFTIYTNGFKYIELLTQKGIYIPYGMCMDKCQLSVYK